MRPCFEHGDEVRLIRNVRDDGTYPGAARGDLLVRRGSVGAVVDIGTFLQDQIIYSVRFFDSGAGPGSGRIVGCREEELIGAAEAWTPSRFEAREKVVALRSFAVAGTVVAAHGSVGEIIRVVRSEAQSATPTTDADADADAEATQAVGAGVLYHVSFPGAFLCIPEASLGPLDDRAGAQP